mmetsp:Transcript_17623/g.71226  ORF Transcript_17623/g.71226 Transcript_17623/m.71226 type:complete len:87 (-) Transcript_17623:1761-2021(-)
MLENPPILLVLRCLYGPQSQVLRWSLMNVRSAQLMFILLLAMHVENSLSTILILRRASGKHSPVCYFHREECVAEQGGEVCSESSS